MGEPASFFPHRFQACDEKHLVNHCDKGIHSRNSQRFQHAPAAGRFLRKRKSSGDCASLPYTCASSLLPFTLPFFLSLSAIIDFYALCLFTPGELLRRHGLIARKARASLIIFRLPADVVTQRPSGSKFLKSVSATKIRALSSTLFIFHNSRLPPNGPDG